MKLLFENFDHGWWDTYYDNVDEEDSQYAECSGYHIGDSVPGYEEYEIVGFLVAKDEYYDGLSNNGLEEQLLVSDGEDTFPAMEVGRSLCPLDMAEALGCVGEDDEDYDEEEI